MELEIFAYKHYTYVATHTGNSASVVISSRCKGIHNLKEEIILREKNYGESFAIMKSEFSLDNRSLFAVY